MITFPQDEIPNPPRIRTFYILAGVCIALVVFSAFTVILLSGKWVSGNITDTDYLMVLGSMLFLIAASTAVLPVLWRRFVSRCPLSVTIQKKGFLMKYRISDPIFVPWDDLRGLYISQSDEPGFVNRAGTAIIVLPKGITMVSREIAEVIRETYHIENGQYPAVWNGEFYNLRKLRKGPKVDKAHGAEEPLVGSRRRRIVILIAIIFLLIEMGFLIWFVVDNNPFMVFVQFVTVVTWVVAITYGVLSTRK